MTKIEAQKRWNEAVDETAKYYEREFPNVGTLDPEWSGTAFEGVPSEVVKTLGLSDPWKQFHGQVEAKI